MDYLNTKKQILELKLEHVKLLMEKNEMFRSQQYEAAAQARDRERKLLSELAIIRLTVLKRLEEMKVVSSNLEEIQTVMDLLIEFNQDKGELTYTELKQQFIERMKAEYEQLWNERRQLQQEFRFSDAREIQNQLIEFGHFLMRYGG
jgi:hypothetical protein